MTTTARVSGTANTAVSWSASAGSISSSGVFTAPKVTSNTPVVITVTSGTDSALPKDATVAIGGSRASAMVTITPVTPSDSLSIAKLRLAAADAGAPYEASLAATGGVAPYQWSVANGSLPSRNPVAKFQRRHHGNGRASRLVSSYCKGDRRFWTQRDGCFHSVCCLEVCQFPRLRSVDLMDRRNCRVST